MLVVDVVVVDIVVVVVSVVAAVLVALLTRSANVDGRDLNTASSKLTPKTIVDGKILLRSYFTQQHAQFKHNTTKRVHTEDNL